MAAGPPAKHTRLTHGSPRGTSTGLLATSHAVERGLPLASDVGCSPRCGVHGKAAAKPAL